MSKATKKKHVTRETIDYDFIPENGQFIAKVVQGRGNNLHEVISQHEDHPFLVSMPPKFRSTIWIKRDDFVIVDPIEEGNKVRGEIAAILFKSNIQYLMKVNLWPEKFKSNQKASTATCDSEPSNNNSVKVSRDVDDMMPPSDDSEAEYESCSDEGKDFVCHNPNRPRATQVEEDSSESEDG